MKIKHLSVTALLLLSGCAFNSQVTAAADGVYTITSTESDAGGSLSALEWEVAHQADKVCQGGWEQISQARHHNVVSDTYTTTIRCVP